MEKVQEKEIKKIISEKFTKNNFLILVLMGILLLVIAWPVKDDSENSDRGTNSLMQSGQLDSKGDIINLQSDYVQNTDESNWKEEESYAYASYLEASLEEMLSTMDGVGKVRVMITLENLGETVIEKDKNTVRNSTTEVDSAGGSRNTTDFSDVEETVYGADNSPYISKMMTPSIQGVVVSAQGGGDENVAKNISEAIQALFGIEPHKIKIVKMISQ